MRKRPLAEQVIVITGASSGIGLVTARRAAAAGARVFLVSRNEAALSRIVAGITQGGGQAGFAVADVADRDALATAARAAVDRFGRIDSWVSNAGVAIYAPLLETPVDEHRRMFETNYFGTVNSTAVAMPHLTASRGTLVIVGSVAGDMPSPIMGAYAASKHAVRAFASSLRIELNAAASPVAVTLIKPSGINTPIAENAANHQAGAGRIPPPPYDPELVAEAILEAAVHPRRERSVGGFGVLEVLFANHFPGLFERLAPAIIPLLSDARRPPDRRDNLQRPKGGNAERTAREWGKPFSVYQQLSRRPGLTAMAVAGVAGLGVLALRSRGE
jgi:NADP-dependent 3-hydroxy acid dehydrogenase YdfG